MRIFKSNTRSLGGTPLVLNFLTNSEIPDGHAGLIPFGLITSHPGLGATLPQGQGALSIIFPKISVPEAIVKDLAITRIQEFERAVQSGKEVEPIALSSALEWGQHGWILKEYKEVLARYFDGDLSPSYGFAWSAEKIELDDPYCQYYRLENVEVLVTGVPNGHPSWDGNDKLS